MSLCNSPTLSLPAPPTDVVAILKALLALLGISIPPMPSIPGPPVYCPLD